MEKLKSEGAYDKVLNEMQKQYDEFLKKQKIIRSIDFVYSFLKTESLFSSGLSGGGSDFLLCDFQSILLR